MNVYRRDFVINDSHADFNKILRISNIFDFIQTATTEHILDMPMYQELYKYQGDYAFILTNIWGKIFRPLKYGEILSIVTYQRPLSGATIYRDFDFYIGDCHVGEAITAALLVDLNTGHLLKTTLFAEPLNTGAFHGECKNKRFVSVKSKKLLFAEKYRVRYSDSDKNRHMNNVRYAEIICDSINLENQNEYISEMQIDFKSECYVGTELNIYTGKEKNKYFARGADQHNKVKFEAYALLNRIVG